jgi:hypothetical protein
MQGVCKVVVDVVLYVHWFYNRHGLGTGPPYHNVILIQFCDIQYFAREVRHAYRM